MLPSKVVLKDGLRMWTGLKKDRFRPHLRFIEKHRGITGFDICVMRPERFDPERSLSPLQGYYFYHHQVRLLEEQLSLDMPTRADMN
jgi:hypothetical protein